MSAALVIAAAYLLQLGLKAGLALSHAGRVRARAEPIDASDVTLLQPILSGDPALRETLESNLRTLSNTPFIWLINDDDAEGWKVARALVAAYPQCVVTMIGLPDPPQGCNPKVFKLIGALDRVKTSYLVVLDDDTRITGAGLRALVHGLQDGASLATGLPRYHAAQGFWSPWLAEFVNSGAVLTYLPGLRVARPLTIHGMCYAMRTDDARRLDVFRAIERDLTDDLALALLLRRNGLTIHQTLEPHDIATSLSSLAELWQIMQRWFVFIRILLGEYPAAVRILLALAYGLPPLLLWALILVAWGSATGTLVLAVTLIARALTVQCIKRRFLGAAIACRPIASLVMECVQPVLLLTSAWRRTLRWRTRTIRVLSGARFEYR